MIAGVVSIVAVFALSPWRLRLAAYLGLAVLPVLAALPVLLDVYRHGTIAGSLPFLHDAATAVILSVVAAVAVGACAARVERGVHLTPGTARRLERGLALGAAVIAVAGLAAFVGARGGPARFVDQRVSEFTRGGYPDLHSQGVRFGANVGSNRNDFWRVALHEGIRRPLGGGAGSFQLDYLRERRSHETPTDPHSVEMLMFSELRPARPIPLLQLRARRDRGGHPLATRRTCGVPRRRRRSRPRRRGSRRRRLLARPCILRLVLELPSDDSTCDLPAGSRLRTLVAREPLAPNFPSANGCPVTAIIAVGIFSGTAMDFFNRQDELKALEERWDSDRAEYMVIYGRRRIGKTELILRFADRRRCLYFEATSGTKNDHLADISELLAELTGRPLLRQQPLTSWGAVFAAIEEALESGPLVVALDEFQFVARQSADIGSQINRFWRRQKGNPNLFFVLSGSDVGFFEKEIVGYAASSYGRRTGSMRLRPFAPDQIAYFLPQWKPEDLVRAYAVFGGVPYYLENLNARQSLAQNIWRVILAPDGLLHEEPLFLFSQQSDLRQDSIYFSTLRAIAAGQTKRNEIAQRIGRSSDQTGEMLGRLAEMGLVKKVHPVTVANPDRTKTVRYTIDDPFLRFWFAFVHPHAARLHSRESAKAHLERRVLPALDAFVAAPTFETICQRWLRREVDAAAAGSWWGSVKERPSGKDRPVNVLREIDTVAIDADGRVLAVGSCKWTAGKMPASEKALLERLVPSVVREDEEPDLYFFSRSGFSDKLRQEAAGDSRCHLVSVAELF